MAGIDKKEIEHLGQLARIKLEPQRIEQLEKDLGTILEYVDALKQVATDGLPEIAQVTGLKNILRSDEPTEQEATPEKLLEQVPDKKDSYIKVKAIFE